MSFSTKTDNLVKDLIQAEYNNACDNFGGIYHSLHEGYAVLLEEVEESENEFTRIKQALSFLWANIKFNGEQMIESDLDLLQRYTQNTIKELAQVGAVLMKMQNTLGKDTNVVTNDEVKE